MKMISDTPGLTASLPLVLSALLVGAVTGGCGEDTEIPNAEATIAAVGAIEPPVEGCRGAQMPAMDTGSTDAADDAGDAGTSDAGQPAVGPRLAPSRVDDAVVLPYLIRDPEGDDQAIRVEICEWDGSQPVACGVAIQAGGGDGTERVPTTPAGACVLHVFHWDAACGRFVRQDGSGASRIEVDSVDQQLVARISVAGGEAEPTVSQPFSLADERIGFQDVPECL